jgi:hypothetical protein
VRRQDQLERDVPERPLAEPLERVVEGLAGDELLARVLATPAHAVLLLGDVRELEVQGKGTQHIRLALKWKRRHGFVELVVLLVRARRTCERSDPLDVLEQRLALLLDEHAPKQVPEQADVAPERRIGGGLLTNEHGASLGGNRCKPNNPFSASPSPR